MEVAIVGAGRTGSRVAEKLAGFPAKLAIIDRDVVEESDLRGSTLYSRKSLGKLKANEAAKAVARATPIADHLSSSNIGGYLRRAGAVLDCTDNWRTRALANEYCWREGKPWVYCGALASKAMCSSVVPKKKPCWLCWNEREPARVLSCSVYGIDPLAAEAAAEKAVEEVKKILAGKPPELAGKLFFADVKKGIAQKIKLKANSSCKVCAWEEYPVLENGGPEAVQTCGTGQWQFLNAGLDKKIRHYKLGGIERRLTTLDARIFGAVVKARALGGEALVFPQGRVLARAIDARTARSLNEFVVQKLLS